MRPMETLRRWYTAARSKREQLHDSAVIESQRTVIARREQTIAEQKELLRQRDEKISELESLNRVQVLELEKLADVCTRDRERVLAETATMTNRVVAPNIQLSVPPTSDRMSA